jgi:uncharacterized membrane protein
VDEYGLLLFLHVLGAAFWAGGVVIFYLLMTRMNAASDRDSLRGLLAHSEKLSFGFFMPVSLVTLIAGISLVLRGDWQWSEPFVIVGLAGIATTVILGAVLSVPREKALMETLSRPGASDNEIRSAFLSLRTISQLDLLVLVVVIFFMTVKPGT